MSEHAPNSPHDGIAGPASRIPLPRIRDDTIVARATPRGRGAIGIVRLSGAEAEAICARVVVPHGGWPVRARTATRCRVYRADAPGAILDDGLLTVFPRPASYTGETVIELGLHGGVFVCDSVCASLIAAGARMAEPGEFTERAVLHGKLDLVRAEAIADLIDARSAAGHRQALQQLSGVLTDRFIGLRESILSLEALLAYEIDFPEEDDGRLSRVRVAEEARDVARRIGELLSTVPAAILGRDGATVVLAGAPNAGKSSLFNALLGERRVIVSDTPGTTRDAVEVLLECDPWPIRLVDTAGLRVSEDAVEREGVATSERLIAQAHIVIACADQDDRIAPLVEALCERTAGRVIGVRTKADLIMRSRGHHEAWLDVSAVRGDGVHELLARVTREVEAASGVDPDVPVLTRARHRLALEKAHNELEQFAKVWWSGALPAPVAAVHVRTAGAALDELIGTIDVDAIFARVFSTFCVGK